MVLKSGAAAALLALAIGLLVARPAGQKLAKLHEGRMDGAVPAPNAARQLAALRMRAAVSSRLAAGLLGVAVLAMAVFRYASAVV